MDEKLKSVLENEELMARIAAAVRGTATPPTPQPLPVPQSNRTGDALALLTALKPFLKKEKQVRLESLSKAISAANIYNSVKNV